MIIPDDFIYSQAHSWLIKRLAIQLIKGFPSNHNLVLGKMDGTGKPIKGGCFGEQLNYQQLQLQLLSLEFMTGENNILSTSGIYL